MFLLLIVLLILGALIFWFAQRGRAAVPAANSGGTYTHTTTLAKSSLSKSVTVTGTVESARITNITTSLPNKVLEIAVQVGDKVNEGDIICKLDTADIEKEIAKKQETLGGNAATAQTNCDKTVAGCHTAVDKAAAKTALAAARQTLTTAENNFVPAKNPVAAFQANYITLRQKNRRPAHSAQNVHKCCWRW